MKTKITKKRIVELTNDAFIESMKAPGSAETKRVRLALSVVVLALLKRTRLDDLLGTSGRLSKGERTRRDALVAAMNGEAK